MKKKNGLSLHRLWTAWADFGQGSEPTRISTEEDFWDLRFSGENQTLEAPLKMGKIGGLWLFLFVCFVVLLELFCLLLLVVVDGCLLVVCCFRNWDAEIRRRNLHEAFGREN